MLWYVSEMWKALDMLLADAHTHRHVLRDASVPTDLSGLHQQCYN